MEDVNKLRYLEAVCKEATRVYTNPLIARKISDDFKVDDKVIPKGTTVIIDILGTHHNPELYPEPMKFQPERFLGKQPPYTFLTWSAGPRNCIGQKFGLIMLKTVVCLFLRKYRIESMVPLEKMKPKIGFITRPSLPVHTRFHKRKV